MKWLSLEAAQVSMKVLEPNNTCK